MNAAGTITILAVALILAALVYCLVSVIVQLRKIIAGLDDAIAGVSGILEKSAPVNEVVTTINQQLDAGVDLLEGLLVKKAGLSDAVGLVEGLYPGAAAAGLRNFPESSTIKAPRIGEVYTKGHAHAGTARPGGADRGREPGRSCAAGRRGRESRGADAVPGDPSDAARVPPQVPRHRHRRGNAVETPVSASNEPPPGHTRKETEGVFVVTAQRGVFTPVKVGIAGEQYFEVLSGLKAGDAVITGPFNSVRELSDGGDVKVQQNNNRNRNRTTTSK